MERSVAAKAAVESVNSTAAKAAVEDSTAAKAAAEGSTAAVEESPVAAVAPAALAHLRQVEGHQHRWQLLYWLLTRQQHW